MEVLPNPPFWSQKFSFWIQIKDVLSDDKGECVICLEELNAGDVIARLPCLCIYHKRTYLTMQS
uniref:RING-type E3 ubiquitin transferase n=1 Tax=Megaselia scalaris TaxID=36166 RepID=T1GRB9_MEGSC